MLSRRIDKWLIYKAIGVIEMSKEKQTIFRKIRHKNTEIQNTVYLARVSF